MRSRNYFLRHWQGDLSLPVSYWINGSLFGVSLTFAYGLIALLLENVSLRTASVVSILLLAFLVAAVLWSSVGIWRSAANHPARGGSRGWALAAQIATVIGLLSFTGTLTTTIGPQLKVYTLIETGHDPMGRIDATVSTKGDALILHGLFGAGSAGEVRRLLEAAPGVRTVMLDSGGGRIKEAQDVADLVAGYGLDTYVESHCESACTHVFLAGRDRAATPNAKIGFHRPTFVGFNELAERKAWLLMKDAYQVSGISQGFLDMVAATPPEGMWYPTREELIANGVINRVSLGGETASLTSSLFLSKADVEQALREVPLLIEYERHFPGALDQAVEAAWRARESGASDAEMLTASRTIFASYVPELLAAANNDQLAMFVQLAVDQLSAAKSVSAEACGLLIASRLDVTKVLPEELVEREMDWALSVLEGPLAPRSPVDPAQLEPVLDRVIEGISQTDLLVFTNMNAYAEQPALQCDAAINFYRAVMSLPKPDRTLALRGIFQAGE